MEGTAIRLPRDQTNEMGTGIDEGTKSTMTRMTKAEIEATVVGLMEGKELDKIAGWLGYKYPTLSRGDVLDIVHDAAVAAIARMKKGARIENLAAFITTAARNIAQTQVTKGSESEALADYRRVVQGAAHSERDKEGEELQRKKALEYVNGLVDAWPTESYKTTMQVILAAARDHEYLDGNALAAKLGCSAATARSWKSRAIARLKDRVAEDGIAWDDFVVADLDDEDEDEIIEETSGEDHEEEDDDDHA